MINLIIRKSAFNETFYPLLEENSHRIFLLVGGGGSGKSYFAFQRSVIKALKDKRKFLVIRKSATDLRRSCWEDLLRTIEQFQITHLCKINKTQMTVEMPNGSLFLCMGLDDYEKVKSIPSITDILIEEASEITFDDFSQLKMRTRGSQKLKNQIILMTNPVSKANWIYKNFFENGNKEKSCIIHHSTYKDNKWLDTSAIEALESYKETNPYFYKVYCLGEFGSMAKNVFNNYKIENLNLDTLRKQSLTHLVGLDFGYVNDATTIIESLLDEENKKLYILREFYRTGLLNNEIAAQLHLMGLAKSRVVADSAEHKSIEEIRREGITGIKAASKGAGSILQGIQKLQQYEIHIDSACVHTIEEFENYSWQKEKHSQEYINKPVDAYNHCIDALRYSLQCANSKIKSLPLGSL